MLNHKFYLSGAEKEDHDRYIRISNMYIQELQPELCKYKFEWYGYDSSQYGLSESRTILKWEELKKIQDCFSKQTEYRKEQMKLKALVQRALSEKKDIIHDDGSPCCMVHDFVICPAFPEDPEEIDYNYYKNDFIKIQDQFIMENYDVFKTVELYWEGKKRKIGGFNYYGTTFITPEMAQELINAMEEFLKDNCSEEAEYFVGEEYDTLVAVLNEAIKENKVVIHFGI